MTSSLGSSNWLLSLFITSNGTILFWSLSSFCFRHCLNGSGNKTNMCLSKIGGVIKIKHPEFVF